MEYDPDAEAKVVADILYPHAELPLAQVRALAAGLSADERLAIIRAYVGERGSRFHKPGRAFERPYYSFDILANLGAYRDLQRHRIQAQERQAYSVRHGYQRRPSWPRMAWRRRMPRRSSALPKPPRRSVPICPSKRSTWCRWPSACAGASR